MSAYNGFWGDVSGSDGGANPRTTRVTLRSSPRTNVQNKEKRNERKTLRKRKKVVRLKSAGLSNKGKDMDFVPSSDDEIGDEAERGQGCTRKRRRKQMRDPAPTTAAGSAMPIDPKKKPVSIRCSPSKFLDIVKALDEPLKAEIPNSGGDPPFLKDDEARVKRRELGVQKRTLTGDLGLRAFFMAAFQSLLLSNTDPYIRFEDVSFTEDLQNIGNRNGCKAIVDSLRKAARLYKKDFPQKDINAPITGCRIFLMMLYVDNLQHGLDTNPFSLPRCAFLDTKTIEEISAKDHSETIEFGNLKPPPVYPYPSFGASFGQSIADVVGRSRKSEALRILKAFDNSTSEAQKFMAKAVEYTSRSQELMLKAHHECFSAMQKLLVDARAEKIAANEARRSSRATNDDATIPHTTFSGFGFYRQFDTDMQEEPQINDTDSGVVPDVTNSGAPYKTATPNGLAIHDDAPRTYIRRNTCLTRSSSVLESEGAKEPDAAAQKGDQHFEVVGKNAEASKKVAAGKKQSCPKRNVKKVQKTSTSFKSSFFKQVGARLKKKPRKYISPFKLSGSRPNVPLSKALALRNKIASDEKLKETTLIDYNTYISFDGNDLITSFADDKDGDSSILDFTVHCLRYCPQGRFDWVQLKEVESIYMDDGVTETEQFKLLWQHLDREIEHYSDITNAKLIFIPVCAQRHYFVYCINLIHQRIDILDSIDYFWRATSLDTRHEPIKNKLPFMNAAFQKVSGNKFPLFDKWSTPLINLPKQVGPSDCMFFLWKYMEFWDGESLHTDINPFKGMIYRVELMHYLMFHPLNQVDLPDELDIYRLGGMKVD
ncbi:uncharacterized protein C2845_PM15G06920 [Panicum miliaceum]|uniref:Ubiquitin-like protease family profile domain-containing protein n=1 Tax=Panicum miliaceum TaxID=4540 RepID=A0A3L6Q622_PANMI|nr:uncharacterized protein C2845_PM15G06920 [Panicum miliaceum]